MMFHRNPNQNDCDYKSIEYFSSASAAYQKLLFLYFVL